MADKKITELPAYSVLSATDVIPVVDISADTTVKVPINAIIPEGGTSGYELAKASGDDFDTEWVLPFSSRVAVIEWRGAAGANGPILNSGVLNDCLFDTEPHNTIPSFGIKSGTPGTLEFPVGIFLIQLYLCGYNTRETRMYLQVSGGAIVLAGATMYSTPASPSILSGVLTVASPAEYEIVVSVRNSLNAGIDDGQAFVAYETYGQGIIQQIG